jgi:hypothetical protein
MEVTQKVNAAHGRKAPGRIEIRADEEGLTPHAGLAITGELARRTGLVGLLDGEVAANRRAAPVKRRDRGASPGELLTAIAEAQLAGAECFSDLEDLRADEAGAQLRAVGEVPSASTAPAARQVVSPKPPAARRAGGRQGRGEARRGARARAGRGGDDRPRRHRR